MPRTNIHRCNLSAEYVRSLLVYEHDTGIFRWLVARSSGTPVGSIAGTPHSAGYVEIGIDGQQYLAHRLAFLYMTGEWPKEKLDHKDRVRNNNVWTNLRPATGTQNNINSKRKSRRLPRGVAQKYRRFLALTTIYVDGQKKQITIGRFDTPGDAHEAWRAYVGALHGQEFLPPR